MYVHNYLKTKSRLAPTHGGGYVSSRIFFFLLLDDVLATHFVRQPTTIPLNQSTMTGITILNSSLPK